MRFVYKLVLVLIMFLLPLSIIISAQDDTDGDGIPDSRDHCPTESGPRATNGCPAFSVAPPAATVTPQAPVAQPIVDSDGDSVADSEDVCPQVPGYPEWNGCPDTDGDGLTTQYDNCPEEYGSRENLGCPDNDPTATPQILALPVLPEDNCYVGTLTATIVNIRPTASTDDTPVDTLDPYQPQIAIAAADGWIQLENGGFVSETVVRMSNSCNELIGSNDIDDLAVVADDGEDGYKCVYFRALFRNTGEGEHVLLIHLTDAIGEGSANHIGPALVPAGETYYAEKHFLVPESWEEPAHPSAGWQMIDDEWMGQFETDAFDFSLIGSVDFLVTFLEDCTSPQPVCYHTTITVNNPTTETRLAGFFMAFASDDIDITSGESNIVWILSQEGGSYQSYAVPPGQTTHNFYQLSPWHYDESEHLNLQLDSFASIPQILGSAPLLQIMETSEVEIVPIDSINHLCELNPVQLSGVSSGSSTNLTPLPEDLVCYYFEQEFDNLTDLTITSPEYQLVVYHRQSNLPAFDVFSDTFSTTVFSNGDKLQYLRRAPRYELASGDPSSELFISHRQLTPLDDGLVVAGPTLFMIVDDSYCENDSMPFTHDELFEDEGITHACYRIQINYNNMSNSDVYITAQLLLVAENGSVSNYGDPVTKEWSAAESQSRIFTIVAQPPQNGYLDYTLEGVDDLTDEGDFWVTYNCPLAQ